MTRRRSSYRVMRSLQRDNRGCRACVEAGFPLESLPIVQPYEGQRAYMFGQAPGIVEGEERRPWRGRAGRTLRRWLQLDEDAFYATFYCASVTRCYPGKAPSGRGDRTPTPREQQLCSLLGLRSVSECVGERYEREGSVAIPLPHPSGASGWLNSPANRGLVEGACALIRAELEQLGDASAGG